MNSNQGIIRGEAILEGDASAGIDFILYSITPAWEAVTREVSAEGPSVSSYVTAIGSPFIEAMVGTQIVFDRNGPAIIVEVLSVSEIRVNRSLSWLVGDDRAGDTFSIAGQESLREVVLGPSDTLHITDVFLSQEKKSRYAVVVNDDTPGRRLTKGHLPESGSVNMRFETPFVCEVDGVLRYFGHDNGLNVCLIHGYIT